mgnify:CR=1 FL=1|jgi:type I restriction-modification system S subunit
MREDWDIRLFKDVFDLQMGKTPDRKNFSLFEGDNTWVSIKDLDGKYISNSKECISDEAAKNIRLVKRGTVIMSFKLTIGKTAIAGKDLYTNEAIMAFNLRNGYDIDASFLYYYLKNYRWEGSNKAVMGITLNKATISKHKIAIPPKSTQLSIVSELDKLNELIQIKKEQLKDYDALAQSIFYEMFGDPVVNEKGWEVKKFGDLFKLKSGDGLSSKDFKTGIYPVYGGNGISGYHNSFNMKGCYIIIGRVGIYCGNVRKVDGEFWLTDNAFRLIYKENEQNPFFILYLLNILDLHQYANAAAQPVISNLTLKSINVPLPPLSLQQSFAHKIEQIERQKAEVQKAITDLESLLAARMQYWFD